MLPGPSGSILMLLLRANFNPAELIDDAHESVEVHQGVILDRHAQHLLDGIHRQAGAAFGHLVDFAQEVSGVDLVVIETRDVHPQVARDREHAGGLGNRVDREEHHAVGARSAGCYHIPGNPGRSRSRGSPGPSPGWRRASSRPRAGRTGRFGRLERHVRAIFGQDDLLLLFVVSARSAGCRPGWSFSRWQRNCAPRKKPPPRLLSAKTANTATRISVRRSMGAALPDKTLGCTVHK